MPITERSSIEGPTLQRSPQTSRMGFASLVYPMSMVWASNTADSSLLLPHNKSLDASGGCAFLNLLGAAKGALIRAAASTQPLGRFPEVNVSAEIIIVERPRRTCD